MTLGVPSPVSTLTGLPSKDEPSMLGAGIPIALSVEVSVK